MGRTTSDRGLCGGLNIEISKKVLSHINEGKREKIISVGTKGCEYFKLRGKNVICNYNDVSETVFYSDAEGIARYLATLYITGEIDEAFLAYTQYKSVLTHIPRIVQILPLRCSSNNGGAEDPKMNLDPNVHDYLYHAVPMYLNASIYEALVESSACEHAARMVSMDTAVHNAFDIITKLTRTYNRKRQATITQELSEIVTSSNMLG